MIAMERCHCKYFCVPVKCLFTCCRLAARAGKTDKLLDQMNRLTRECTQLKVTLEVTKVDLEKSKDTHKVVPRDPLPPSTPRGKLEV